MKRWLDRLRLKNSLLSQYLLIVLCALILVPTSLPIVTVAVMLPMQAGGEWDERYQNGLDLEQEWHAEAKRLNGANEEELRKAMEQFRARYPEAGLFWVDNGGELRIALGEISEVPAQWTASYTVQFMKERSGGDPFTVVAFVGGPAERDNGFMVMEVKRALMISGVERARTSHGAIFAAGTLIVLGLFLFFSLLFFYRIRRRLVRLQAAMASPIGESGIPTQIEPMNEDEIGRLERSFNAMIGQLTASRSREAEEEALRKDLVAKLSHDLRTPLTAIRGHAYSLREEERLTDKGLESVALIERKIEYLGRLIDNLFSYSLLSAGKYPYDPRSVDIVRAVRTWFAGWYPVFEQEGFEIELDMPEDSIHWPVDPEWLERILDNYCQNAMRHARSGRYIGVTVKADRGGMIAIRDRGPGLTAESNEKGAGLGLSIAALMLREMQLRGEYRNDSEGTTVVITPAGARA
jgi:signal transduction histidine kinase